MYTRDYGSGGIDCLRTRPIGRRVNQRHGPDRRTGSGVERRPAYLKMAISLLAAAAAATACSDDQPVAAPSTSAPPVQSVPCGSAETVQYSQHDGVSPELNSLDVHTPPPDANGECTGRPLVIWIHGGGWTEGDKASGIDDKVRLFTGAGYVFASVNYRLTDPNIVPAAPRHPVHDQDAADAVAWLLSHADEIGADPDRVAVLGHSAGGGITAAITTDDTYLSSHGLDVGAIRCAGSIDGEGYDVTRGATHPDPNVNITYLNAFGDDPAVWATASPVNNVRAGAGIPDFFVAARGTPMRLDLHGEFVEALRSADVAVTVVDARELDHAEVSDDIGAPGDTVVTPVLMEFLGGCLDR